MMQLSYRNVFTFVFCKFRQGPGLINKACLKKEDTKTNEVITEISRVSQSDF